MTAAVIEMNSNKSFISLSEIVIVRYDRQTAMYVRVCHLTVRISKLLCVIHVGEIHEQ